MTSAGTAYGLGLDTGGTYTDAAIVDLATTAVMAKAKSPTTHYDLSIGLRGAVDGVLGSGAVAPGDIAMVGVSTTLATNSILEGKGGRVGLVGIGWTPDREWELGAHRQAFIGGGHDVRGRPRAPLDLKEAARAVDAAAEGADAMVVSSLFSIYNPEHEHEVAGMVRERGLPVVMGHELTAELGIHERTVTAVLNARLLPIIRDFLEDVQGALEARGITAPVMVFKGDGTLMSLAMARARPVETILSGPAASAVGGGALAGLERCVVVDIGGTSTDIAFLDHGVPRVSEEGATVGRWRTRVRAADAWTCALGGDSRIGVSTAGELEIMPERVMPLCFAASRHHGLVERMRALQEVDFLLAYPKDPAGLGNGERKVHEHLRLHGPLTRRELRRALPELYMVDAYLDTLRGRDLVIGIGPTPTDVLHATGAYREGDAEAARLGMELLGLACGRTAAEVASSLLKTITDRIAREVATKLVLDASGGVPGDEAGRYVLDAAIGARGADSLRFTATLDRPLVGIGAPTHVLLPPVEARLRTEVVLPPDHDVGNAVGAVCSQVSLSAEVMIFPKDFKFHLFCPFALPETFEHQAEAVERARRLVTEHVRRGAERAGAHGIRVYADVIERRSAAGYLVGGDVLTQIEVRARAVGDPTIVHTR